MSIQVNRKLMNFVIEDGLKSDFQNLCKIQHKNMSSKIVDLINDFVSVEREKYQVSKKQVDEFRMSLNSFNDSSKSSKHRNTPISFFGRV